MALSLSERISKIAPSVTLAIDAKAKELAAAGEDVIGFGAGEPDYETPEHIRKAAKEAIDKGMTRYTPVPGTLALRKAISAKFQRDNGLTYDPADIVVSSGAKHSLFNALSAILNPGDEVLFPAPYWISYPEMVHMAGGTPVYVNGREEDNFLVSAEQLAPYVTDRTKALILNSPNNPNGCVWNEQMLRDIAELAVEKGFYIISDEIYEKLIYDGNKHVSIASLGDAIKAQTIVVNGVSKSYAMTGWRIGYAAGPKPVVKAMSSFQSHATSNANSIAQHASMIALESGDAEVDAMVREFDLRRRLMFELVNNTRGLSANMPEGAFYMMVNISGVIGKKKNGRAINGSMDFAEMLLDAHRVAVVPGLPFGADQHVRLSYAISQEKITRGLDRISRFIGELTD